MSGPSDIDLPLWNRSETDVLPQYQLSYGHVIVGTGDVQKVESGLRRVLHLGQPARANSVPGIELPANRMGIPTLATTSEWHFLLASGTEHVLLFGPHRLFFSSEPWSMMGKRLRTIVILVTRMVESEFNQKLFRGSERAYDAYTDPEGVHLLEDKAVAVRINGELAYQSPRFVPIATEQELRMMRADRFLDHDSDGNVFLRSIFDEDKERPETLYTDIRHYVYPAGKYFR